MAARPPCCANRAPPIRAGSDGCWFPKPLQLIKWEPQDEEQRAMRAIALSKWDELDGFGTAAIEPLVAVLRDSDSTVRSKAAGVLGVIGDACAVEPLIAALQDDDGSVRSNAAWALGKIKDARAVEPLMKTLYDDNESVCNTATWALERIGYTRTIEPLLSLIWKKKPNRWDEKGYLPSYASRGAIEALEKILGEQLPGLRQASGLS